MFATDLRRFIDWDLFLRMSRHVTPLAIPVVLSTYDQPSSRISVSLDESRQQNLDAIDRRIRRDAVRHPDGPVSAAISPVGSDAVLEAWRTTTVVIPNYEALAHLRRCVDSVREHSPGTELIIVDNDSGPASQRYLDMLAQEGVRVIRNEANLGFSHAVNQGIAVATADNDIVLLNNDARVTAGWLEAMHDVLARFPEVGIVAPRQVLDAGEPTIRTHVPGADPARACDCNLSAHHRNVLDPSFDPHRGLVELTFAPFFCVLIRRNVVDAIGPLDHIRAPHYRSDRLYCDQVRSFGGHRIVYTPHAIVHHAHQRATRDLQNRDQRLHKAMKDDNDWWELRRLQGLQAPTRSAETNGPRSTDRSHVPDPRGVSGRAAITPDAS
jgi:GT2 family glycosyltransferase